MGNIISCSYYPIETPPVEGYHSENTTENSQPRETQRQTITDQEQLNSIIEWAHRAPINEPRHKIIDLIIDIMRNETISDQSIATTLDLSSFENLTSLPEILPKSIKNIILCTGLINFDLQPYDSIESVTIGSTQNPESTIDNLILPFNLKQLIIYNARIVKTNIESLTKLKKMIFSEVKDIDASSLPPSVTNLTINNCEFINGFSDGSDIILADFNHLSNLEYSFIDFCNFNELIIPQNKKSLIVFKCPQLTKISCSLIQEESSVKKIIDISDCKNLIDVNFLNAESITTMSMSINNCHPDIQIDLNTDKFCRI